MTTKSNAERQEALRKRREAAGLKEFRVWIDPNNITKVNLLRSLDERRQDKKND